MPGVDFRSRMQKQLFQAQTGPPTVQFSNRNQSELIIGEPALSW